MRSIRGHEPRSDRIETLIALWQGAGLAAIDTRQIEVRRDFADFDAFWAASTMTGSIRPTLAAMSAEDIARLKALVRAQLGGGGTLAVSFTARANAVKGHVPLS